MVSPYKIIFSHNPLRRVSARLPGPCSMEAMDLTSASGPGLPQPRGPRRPARAGDPGRSQTSGGSSGCTMSSCLRAWNRVIQCKIAGKAAGGGAGAGSRPRRAKAPREREGWRPLPGRTRIWAASSALSRMPKSLL